MCSKSHTKYTVYEKQGLIVLTPERHAVINRATSVQYNLPYVRQCGKRVCKTWESDAHKVNMVSMYKAEIQYPVFNEYIKKVP